MARRLSEKARKAGEALRLRNEIQLKVDNGEIDDPEFLRALASIGRGRDVSEIGGDYFETVIRPPSTESGRKKYLASGKVELAPVERPHGLGQSPASMRAILAQQQMKRGGVTTSAGPDIRPEIARIQKILERDVQLKSINSIGMGGARGNRTRDQKLGIAASLLADTDRGYNRQTGAGFNGVALDAGHIVADSADPTLSDEPTNLIMQNQYMNKGQSATEKMAFQQGREATDEELADGLLTSFINKIMKGSKTSTDGMRKGSKKYNDEMDRINNLLIDDDRSTVINADTVDIDGDAYISS